MKKYLVVISIPASLMLFVILIAFQIKPADPKALLGAWEYGPVENRTVLINTDKVFSVAVYDIPGKKLIHSYGGTWNLQGDKIIKRIEWNSKDPEMVGKELSFNIQLKEDKLILGQTNEIFNRIDNGKPGDLMGTWIITGNYTNDKVSKRASPFYPRRTMKILSGTRFQWIAYNVETKQFMNAGGGTYTTVNGKYTENIEFFTKTPESVGKSLSFQYSFVDGDWRHKGEKSTGGVLDECWSRRETLEKQ